MATKIFCDRCNKEMQLSDVNQVKISSVKISNLGSEYSEVCPDCAKEIIKFVKGKK